MLRMTVWNCWFGSRTASPCRIGSAPKRAKCGCCAERCLSLLVGHNRNLNSKQTTRFGFDSHQRSGATGDVALWFFARLHRRFELRRQSWPAKAIMLGDIRHSEERRPGIVIAAAATSLTIAKSPQNNLTGCQFAFRIVLVARQACSSA